MRRRNPLFIFLCRRQHGAPPPSCETARGHLLGQLGLDGAKAAERSPMAVELLSNATHAGGSDVGGRALNHLRRGGGELGS
jgi:hypothetical protein